jgi:hypothetical protein
MKSLRESSVNEYEVAVEVVKRVGARKSGNRTNNVYYWPHLNVLSSNKQ